MGLEVAAILKKHEICMEDMERICAMRNHITKVGRLNVHKSS